MAPLERTDKKQQLLGGYLPNALIIDMDRETGCVSVFSPFRNEFRHALNRSGASGESSQGRLKVVAHRYPIVVTAVAPERYAGCPHDMPSSVAPQ